MLMILVTSLLLTTLSSAGGSERQFLAPNLVKLKRGVVDAGHHVHRLQSIGPNVPRYRNVKILPQESSYKDVLKAPPPYASSFSVAAPSSESQSHEQLTTHPENLFTISAGYKVANDDNNLKPFKQTRTNVQIPVYKTAYPVAKSTDALQGTAYQNGKVSLPIYLPQKSQESAAYSSNNRQGHVLVQNPRGHRFDFVARTPKTNGNALTGVPFLSPLSSFQGQVVAIPTAANNPQFPQYKGATVEVYPTVGGFSTVAYQPLQAQPQLHFTNVQHVQPMENPHRPPVRSQEIRSDVEIIDKKKPRPPPKKPDNGDDDEEDEEDEGYSSQGHQYGINSDVDSDYRPKPGKYFKSSPTQGDFKPSTSFPFKQYDETFGKYTSSNRDEEADAKPYAKYHAYASTSDDKDDEDEPSGRYHTKDSSPKSYYRNEEEEEDEDGDGEEYEKQRTEESSDGGHELKYFDKDFDEEFGASYMREAPKQKYKHAKDVIEYDSGSSRRSKDNYDSEGTSDQSSRKRINYRKTSPNYDDTEARHSDISSLTSTTAHGESFGHRIPQKRY